MSVTMELTITKNTHNLLVILFAVQIRQSTVRGTSPDGAHAGLHLKPLDDAIERLPAQHRPGSRHGRQTVAKHKTPTKNYF